MTTNMSEDMKLQIETVIEEARRISVDVAEEVEEIFQQGNEHPLDRGKAFELLTKIISLLRKNAGERGDDATSNSLAGDINNIIQRVIQMREPVISESTKATAPTKIKLVYHNRIEPRDLRPKQRFQGVEVPMREGYVNTRDIPLWIENPRTEIQLAEFRKVHGHNPDPEERLQIIWGDEFKIKELATSIALNGVLVSPIIDVDGTLLDGNRRVAACQYILDNKGQIFNDEALKNAEYIWIWQLTEDATDDDKDRVIAARNYAPDYKQEWSNYIKAKQLNKEWEAMLRRSSSRKDRKEMINELAQKFETTYSQAKKYIEMILRMDDFKDYLLQEKGQDNYAAERAADKYYKYLSAVTKGLEPLLDEDREIKHIFYDLLFKGGFKNDEQIPKLKEVISNGDAREKLLQAREMEITPCQECIEEAINIAKTRRKPRQKKLDQEVKDCIKVLRKLNPESCELIAKENLNSLLETWEEIRDMVAKIVERKDGR